jgi:zinc D-Ala-D-Ala carboxypeptidase
MVRAGAYRRRIANPIRGGNATRPSNGGVAHRRPARPSPRVIRIRRIRVAALCIIVVAATVGILGHQSRASSSPTSAAPTDLPRSAHVLAPPPSSAVAPIDLPRNEPRVLGGGLGEPDGAVPDGTTVFDDEVPGVAKTDPALLGALRRAASDAARDGVTFFVESGWRSPAYQERLLREAISKYGSEREAARWVATADTSLHVSGDAVDIGPADATRWLASRGAAYGLCQIYGNESWHYELRPDAIARGCPSMYADPTHDPRMQQ